MVSLPLLLLCPAALEAAEARARPTTGQQVVSNFPTGGVISDSSENVLPSGCNYSTQQIDTSKTYDLCVVGAGLSGTVFAERTAALLGESVLVIDSRPHIGGNCYDFKDPQTGVLRNQYGSHLFHTKIERVWKYVNSPKAPPWKAWYHQKLGVVNNTLVPIPPNIMTVNRLLDRQPAPPPLRHAHTHSARAIATVHLCTLLTVARALCVCCRHIQTPEEMATWLKAHQIACPQDTGCTNGEEMAKSRVGEELYRAIFESYTIKQWGKSPREMDAAVLARIPVYADWDPRYMNQSLTQCLHSSLCVAAPFSPWRVQLCVGCRYFKDKWQALPQLGYTAWFEAMLKDPLIEVVLGVDFFEHRQHLESACGKVVYTGPIDRYFEAAGMERLEYRSIIFTESRHYNTPGYVLPTPVVNYPGPETQYTRAVEYKHYLHRPSAHSVVVMETSSDHGEPYYPMPTPRNRDLYAKYKALAAQQERSGKVVFVGRLANYKYFDMDKAIDNALELFYQSAWTKLFKGMHFRAYKAEVDAKIERHRRRGGARDACHTGPRPAWLGEFGMELRALVPWAYSKSLRCRIWTKGVVGTKYMYWFSDEHRIIDGQRADKRLPSGNPLNSSSVHRWNIPENADWSPPPFKEYFDRPLIREMLAQRPLVVIQNKYAVQWSFTFDFPVNFFSVDELREILKALTGNYTVVYKRHTADVLKDHGERKSRTGEGRRLGGGLKKSMNASRVRTTRLDLDDKLMIRAEFPSVQP